MLYQLSYTPGVFQDRCILAYSENITSTGEKIFRGLAKFPDSRGRVSMNSGLLKGSRYSSVPENRKFPPESARFEPQSKPPGWERFGDGAAGRKSSFRASGRREFPPHRTLAAT